MPIKFLLSLLICLSLVAVAVALTQGSVDISFTQLLTVFTNPGSDYAQIIFELRMPRVFAAYTTGALLALAGALMQVLVRNPLADPYILGISGGAALAVLLSMLLGINHVFGLTTMAFAGALLSMLLVFYLSHRQGSWTPTRLLLTGVVIAAGWGAAISLILTLAPAAQLHGMLFWLMGDLSYSHYPALSFAVLLIGVVFSLLLASQLNVLIRGGMLASTLGIQVDTLHIKIYILASLLTAAAVTQAGSIGFVGFIVPHLLRLAGMTNHRILLPAAVLGGGLLVLIADTLARTIIAPQQIPVGIITALIGIPLFLYLLQRDAKQ